MINKCKNWILSKSTIDIVFKFNGDIDKFAELLNSTDCKDKFRVTKFENDNFEITSKFSVGVGNKGITAYGTIQSVNADNLTIRLKTKIRFEIYMFCMITLIMLIAMFFNNGGSPFLAFLFTIILVPWFNWIYMIQHRGLIEKITRYFDLKILPSFPPGGISNSA